MKRLVVLVLLCFATAARADWLAVGTLDGTTFYIDPASTLVRGELYRVSAMQDLATAEAGVRSRLVLYEVDCGSLAIRSIAVTDYSEPMAKGNRLGERQGESAWLYVTPRTGSLVAPRTPYTAIVRRICATPL